MKLLPHELSLLHEQFPWLKFKADEVETIAAAADEFILSSTGAKMVEDASPVLRALAFFFVVHYFSSAEKRRMLRANMQLMIEHVKGAKS